MAGSPSEQFQKWLEATYSRDERFSAVHSTAGTVGDAGVRLEASEGSHYEILVRPARQEVRVGFLTTDRALNEAIEQSILDSGDSLDEQMEVELDELEEAPVPMAHFFERPAFCYVSSLPLPQPDALATPELRRRVAHLIDACHALFQPHLEK